MLVGLPGGLWRDGVRSPVRQFDLRPLSTEDDVFLLDTDGLGPAARANALLGRCLDGGDETVAALSVGDREALLLELRRLTLGDELDCVLRCPSDDCAEPIELELRVDELLVPAYDDVRRTRLLSVRADGAVYDVEYRLPCSADLEAIGGRSVEGAATELLRRCLLTARRDGEPAEQSLTPEIERAIADDMAEHDPQAELELELVCPVCSSPFTVMFDTASFLLQELDRRATALLRDVHALARHYHWSEREILAMPPVRRARYLDLIAEGRGA